jgi:hypothetical protein
MEIAGTLAASPFSDRGAIALLKKRATRRFIPPACRSR